jgi:outer membrane putative beta-barrel porin/alpha-amylase
METVGASPPVSPEAWSAYDGSMRRSSRCAAIVCGLLLPTASPAFAQPGTTVPELAAGRPGITESAGVAGPGVVQFEGGLELDATPDAGAWSRTFLTPSVLRVGLTSRFEVRLSGDGLTLERTSSAHHGGLADLAVGAKYIVLDAKRAGFELAAIPTLGLPSGADRFSSHRYQPSLTMSLARDLPAGFDLGASVGTTWTRDPHDRRTARAASVAIGHLIAGPWAGFGEIAAADGDDGTVDWLADAGLSRTIGRDAQIDVELGHRLTGGAPDWTFGAGLVIRHVSPRIR